MAERNVIGWNADCAAAVTPCIRFAMSRCNAGVALSMPSLMPGGM